MRKICIIMIILVAGIVAAATYIGVSFYKIEHAYSQDNRLLLTRQVQLQHNLDKYNESFESVMNQILECHSQDNGRLYNLNELLSNDEVTLSYVGIIENNRGTVWRITKRFPDFSRKETIGVKIYNLIFNRGTI